MKKYADRSENFLYQKHEKLNDFLKYHFDKTVLWEKVIKENAVK